MRPTSLTRPRTGPPTRSGHRNDRTKRETRETLRMAPLPVTPLPDVIARYLRAIETGDATAMAECLAPDMHQTEWPNVLAKAGQERGRERILADFDRGRALLQGQSYAVSVVHGAGTQVMVELVWTGTLALPVGGLHPGDRMVAHCAIAFEIRDGLIAAQRNYDCFDPF